MVTARFELFNVSHLVGYGVDYLFNKAVARPCPGALFVGASDGILRMGSADVDGDGVFAGLDDPPLLSSTGPICDAPGASPSVWLAFERDADGEIDAPEAWS